MGVIKGGSRSVDCCHYCNRCHELDNICCKIVSSCFKSNSDVSLAAAGQIPSCLWPCQVYGSLAFADGADCWRVHF